MNKKEYREYHKLYREKNKEKKRDLIMLKSLMGKMIPMLKDLSGIVSLEKELILTTKKRGLKQRKMQLNLKLRMLEKSLKNFKMLNYQFRSMLKN